MNTLSFLTLFVIMSEHRPVVALRDFSTCHDDFSLKPPDGVLKKNTFGWLGFVQYTHVITGLLHQNKAPRVILIQKQFAIGTAIDLLQLPKNYKLGNVMFGEYEREEEDCGMTRAQLKLGERCPHAYLETPLLSITPHPEYSRFGVGNSLAIVKLLRPMKSHYMMPICMPSIAERMKKRKNKFVFMVDYLSNVPLDFNSERMGKKTQRLYTHKECKRHRFKARLTSEGVSHVLCSSGCGVRPGAPIVSQNTEGAFELIGVAAGGALCAKRAMRRRLIKEPPLYIDVYPYTTWIMNVITANMLPQPYPQNFRRTESGTNMGLHGDFLRLRKKQKEGWRARTYVNGNFCYRNKKKRQTAAFFYSEKFEVNADPPARLTILMKISAGVECKIVCARLLLPNRMVKPTIEGVGGYNITVHFSTEWFPSIFFYSLGLLGKNATQADLRSWIEERNTGYW